MKPVARRQRRKTLVQEMAELSAKHVLSESTRNALEKMAEDFAKELLADPEYRAELKREAKAAARSIVKALRKARPELHGTEET
jgi:pantoate kinase